MGSPFNVKSSPSQCRARLASRWHYQRHGLVLHGRPSDEVWSSALWLKYARRHVSRAAQCQTERQSNRRAQPAENSRDWTFLVRIDGATEMNLAFDSLLAILPI
jgi:hypothetical protein